MRFSAIFLTGALAAFAAAETTSSALSPETSSQTAIVKCLGACEAGDVDCRSKCIAVPNPNAAQVNETNKCVSACPQGNGTVAETNAYGKCTKDCIDKYYFNPTTGTPATTTPGAGSGSNTGDSNNNNNGGGSSNNGSDKNDSPSGTKTNSPSGTGSAAPVSKTGNAAAGMVKVAGGGLLALVMGVLAL